MMFLLTALVACVAYAIGYALNAAGYGWLAVMIGAVLLVDSYLSRRARRQRSAPGCQCRPEKGQNR